MLLSQASLAIRSKMTAYTAGTKGAQYYQCIQAVALLSWILPHKWLINVQM